MAVTAGFTGIEPLVTVMKLVMVMKLFEGMMNAEQNLELPGLKREDISVQLEEGQLTISGERKVETVSEGTEIHRQERSYGKFARVLTLPTAVADGQVKAAYKDGILTVTLPKAEVAKPKQIDVSVN